jgi:hypothetical protein
MRGPRGACLMGEKKIENLSNYCLTMVSCFYWINLNFVMVAVSSIQTVTASRATASQQVLRLRANFTFFKHLFNVILYLAVVIKYRLSCH